MKITFGIITSPTYTSSNGSKLGPNSTTGYSGTVFEPIDEFKGDVARYLLYFITRYEGRLNLFNHMVAASPLDGSEEKGFEDWYINMLKEWNTLDPVSQRERDRNDAIFSLQKIRNPFIDHPEWVDLIWNEPTDSTAPQAPANVVATMVGESFVSLSWAPSADTDVLGYKIYVNGVYNKYSKSTHINKKCCYILPAKIYSCGVICVILCHGHFVSFLKFNVISAAI